MPVVREAEKGRPVSLRPCIVSSSASDHLEMKEDVDGVGSLLTRCGVLLLTSEENPSLSGKPKMG